MPTPVIMPKYEMGQETGKIARWLKREGDVIEKGEPLLEIETDKTNIEVESRASGTLVGICAEPGQVVPVGQPIAYIIKPGEAWPPAAHSLPRRSRLRPPRDRSAVADGQRRGPGHADRRTHGGRARARPPGRHRDRPRRPDHARRCRGALGGAGHAIPRGRRVSGRKSEGRPGRAPASPRVGRGPDHRRPAPAPKAASSRRMLSRPQKPKKPPQRHPLSARSPSPPALNPAISQTSAIGYKPAVRRIVPLTNIRRTIAERMTQSVREAPQFTVEVDVDMGRAMAIVQDFGMLPAQPQGRRSR